MLVFNDRLTFPILLRRLSMSFIKLSDTKLSGSVCRMLMFYPSDYISYSIVCEISATEGDL
jgi:hypothetical protein